jgi:hypothetical protein
MALRGASFIAAGGDREKATGIMLTMSQTLGRKAIRASRGTSVTAFATQEAAEADFKAHLKNTGMSDEDAAAMAKGGAGASLLAKLGKRPGSMEMIKQLVQAARDSGRGESEADINAYVAKELTRTLGKGVSPEEVAAVRGIIEGGPIAAVGMVNSKTANSMFNNLAKSAAATGRTVSLNEMATSAKSALAGISPELEAAGGQAFQDFKAEVSAGPGGAERALSLGGSGEKMVEEYSKKSSAELDKLIEAGGDGADIARAAKASQKAQKATTNDQLAAALGMNAEQAKSAGIGKGTKFDKSVAQSLIDEMETGAAQGLAAGGTGGIATVGDPTSKLVISVSSLDDSVKKTAEIVGALHTEVMGGSPTLISTPAGDLGYKDITDAITSFVNRQVPGRILQIK